MRSAQATSRVGSGAETTRTLCVGEIEQSTRRYDFEMSVASYEKICAAKTASLYGSACELGARYPGGNEELGRELNAFGRELGLAFQIVDDCLDLTATEASLGKTAGTDVEAICGSKAYARLCRSKAFGTQLRALVLNCEVPVPR